MHPFNQSLSRGRGSRPQGFDRNNSCNNGRGRNFGEYGNGHQFPMQNNPRYGNDPNMYNTNLYENVQNRQSYQGNWNNVHPQRQFQNQQFPRNRTCLQSERQNMRQIEYHQRSRSYPGQFGHSNMQQNAGQFNRLMDRQSSVLSGQITSQADNFRGRQSSPEFESQRGRPFYSESDCQGENQSRNFQNFENVQQGNCSGQQVSNYPRAWDLIKPNLLDMMEKYFSSPSKSNDFNDEQQPFGNFPPYEDQTAHQNFTSPKRYKKKWKKKTNSPFNRKIMPNYSQSLNMKQNRSNQQPQVNLEINENFNDWPGQLEIEKTGKPCTITAAGDVQGGVETNTGSASDEIALTDHLAQSHSEEQETIHTNTGPENDDGSSSVHMVSSKEGNGLATVGLKVLSRNEPNQNLLDDMQTESSPSSKEIQESEVRSVLGEHVGESSSHTTLTGESELKSVQQGMELVSLEGDMSQDFEGDTGSPQQSKDARNLLTRPSSTEKNKSVSPGMKERKQFFGTPLQKGGLGRGKDPPKTPEPGKTWSSNDYFTGGGQSTNKPGTAQLSSVSDQSATSGHADSTNITLSSGSSNKDVSPGQRISVIGERNRSRAGEKPGFRGTSKFGVAINRGEQEGKWNQGRNSEQEGKWSQGRNSEQEGKWSQGRNSEQEGKWNQGRNSEQEGKWIQGRNSEQEGKWNQGRNSEQEGKWSQGRNSEQEGKWIQGRNSEQEGKWNQGRNSEQEGKWKQGRISDVSSYREGNAEPQDRREMWGTPGKDTKRPETIMKGGMESDQKLQSGTKCDDTKEKMASSPRTGFVYKDRFHPGEQRQYNSPNRTQGQGAPRFYGSPQNNSPRGRQERSDYFSQDRRFDRNRGQVHRNSREEMESGSRWGTGENRWARDTGTILSPRDRNQGQYSCSSIRSYTSGQYPNDHNDTQSRSSNRDSVDGSSGNLGEKIFNFDAGSKSNNNPDGKCAQSDQFIPKTLNESKEHSSQSSTCFQTADQKEAKSTMMDADTHTKGTNLNETNCRASEQRSEETRFKNRDQRSIHGSTATGQKPDSEQNSQIIHKSENSKNEEKEMDVSGNESHSNDGKGSESSSRSLDESEKQSNQSSTVCQIDHDQRPVKSTMFSQDTNTCSKDSSLNESNFRATEQRTDEIGNKNQDQRIILDSTATGQKSDEKKSQILDKLRGSGRTETDMDISGYASSSEVQGHNSSTQNKTQQQIKTLSSSQLNFDSSSKEPHNKTLSTSQLNFDSSSKEPHNKTLSTSQLNFDSSSKEPHNKKGVLPEFVQQSPKRQFSCEAESPGRARHSSGSSQGRGSHRDTSKVKNRNRNSSGGSTQSSDTGRPHSRDKDGHVKRSHTSNRSEHRRVEREKSSESNVNSDSSSGGYQVHSHRHRHKSKGDKSSSHRSRDNSSSHGERKAPSRQNSKEVGTPNATGRSSERQGVEASSGQRHGRLSGATERWREEQDYTGGSDVDIDEEDSDDELETPFFLTSLTEASSRPIPSTPTKGINASQTESPTPSSHSPQISLAPLSSLTSGFSLDALLAEAIDKTSEERQCEDMHAELEEGLRKGGFVKDTLEVNEEPVIDENLLPEHQLKLKKFEICKSQMSEVHPGESIFLSQRYQCLFNAAVSLQACGFVPGTTYIDKHLITIQPGDYMTLLTSDIMLMCFDAISCQDAVLRWLLFIMSVHPSHLLINCCYKTIQEHLYSCQHFTCKTKYTWSPAVTDILSILCNYGADPKKLLPKSLVPNTESIRKSLFQQLNMEIQPAAGKYNRENFRLVLSSLAMAFQIRPKYTAVQITQMVIMLSKAALDKSLNNFMLTHEFEVVLASLLKLYTDADWTSQSLTLCRELAGLTEHHHNKVYLAQLLPPTTKGNFLQRRVSFLMIHRLFNPEQEVSDDVVMHFQLGRVHNVLPRLQGLADDDIYLLASCVSLLDLCIGNSIIKSAEKDDLEYITEQIKKMTGEVRDNVQMLDKTRIKDMMIRITSKWTLVLRSIGSKQRTLFECPGNFRKSPAEMKIETVDASQTDQASETDEDEDDARSEEEGSGKRQAKIKSVTVDVKDGSSSPADDEAMDIGDEDDLPEL